MTRDDFWTKKKSVALFDKFQKQPIFYTMKKVFSFALSVTSLISLSLHAGVSSGDLAPDFTLKDSTGAEHSLSDFKGKYVVLEWTNHRCPFVKKFYREGHMQDLQAKLTGQEVVWLQVLSSAPSKQGFLTAEEAEKLRVDQKHNSTAILLDPDGTVGRQYDARTTPHMYLIDPHGTLIYQGAIDSVRSTKSVDIDGAKNYVVEAFEADRVDRPVSISATAPYGCGVKY